MLTTFFSESDWSNGDVMAFLGASYPYGAILRDELAWSTSDPTRAQPTVHCILIISWMPPQVPLSISRLGSAYAKPVALRETSLGAFRVPSVLCVHCCNPFSLRKGSSNAQISSSSSLSILEPGSLQKLRVCGI